MDRGIDGFKYDKFLKIIVKSRWLAYENSLYSYFSVCVVLKVFLINPWKTTGIINIVFTITIFSMILFGVPKLYFLPKY